MKSLFTTAVLLTVATGAAYGQQAVSAEATVLEDLVVNSPQGVSFASIAQDISGGAPTIDPTDGSSSNIQQGDPTRGVVTIAGTGDADVDVTSDASVALSNGTEELDFTVTLAYIEGTSQTATTAVTVSNPETLDGSGDGVVFVGGSLAAGTGNTASNLVGGTYTGSVNVTIEYSGI